MPSRPASCRVLQHRTMRAVGEEIEDLRFDTGIAKLMEIVNVLTPRAARPRPLLKTFVLLLAPFAPHLAEELWSLLGHERSLAHAPWPNSIPRWLTTNRRNTPCR